jgi:formate-dependent nitrite reductase membrane component NrfD
MGEPRVEGRPTIWAQNRHSLTVLLVVAGYLVLAATTGIVLLGIFPVMLALRATRSKEPLRMIAVVAAGAAVVGAMLAAAG